VVINRKDHTGCNIPNRQQSETFVHVLTKHKIPGTGICQFLEIVHSMKGRPRFIQEIH
jgi:hypothetical protein